MNSKKECDLLCLFGEEVVGGEETSVSTEQTTTGETSESTPAAGEIGTDKTRREAFRSMMEGEYKELFTAYFQETFNRRFKEQKGMMEELERARGVVKAAAECFGVSEENALIAAIRTENERKMASADDSTSHNSQNSKTEDDGMKNAIEAAVQEAVRRAREETERAVTESIRARGLRPTENALTPGVGAVSGNTAARLSRAQRAEMARRAAKGERIEF